MHSRGNAPPLGRVMPTPPGAQGPPLGSAAVRGSYAGSGLATSRKPGAGPVELVLRGAPATWSLWDGAHATTGRPGCVLPRRGVLIRAGQGPGGRWWSLPLTLLLSLAPLPTLGPASEPATEPLGGKSPTSVYDTPQDQGAAIKQLLKENQNLKLKVRTPDAKQSTRKQGAE